MKSKTTYISLGLLTITLCLGACNGKGKPSQDGHAHAAETEAAGHDEHDHDPEAGGNIASLTDEQIKSVGIQLGQVELKNLTATIKANGFLRVPNNNRANASSLHPGSIRTLNVQLGDFVKKGQTIATIQNPQFVQLQEDYLNSNNELQLAEQELDRQEELNAGNAGTKRNLQNASSRVQILRTKRASLGQQLQILGINPASIQTSNLRSSIVVPSPLSGVVSNVFVKLGSFVDVSSPILEVVDNSLLHLDLQVFERDLAKIKVGQPIDFTLTNNPEKTYQAKVSRIGASFENDSKTVAVHCVVLGDKTGLIDGMNITGQVSLSDVHLPAVPNEAIVEANGKSYIFMVTDKKPEAEATHQHEEHAHSEGEAHEHSHDEAEHEHEHEHEAPKTYFEKIEIQKGVSHQGYTAIVPFVEIPKDRKIVVKSAFFINAKLTGTVGHSH